MKKTMPVLSLFLLFYACQEPVITETQSQDLTQGTPGVSASQTPAPASSPSTSEQVTLQGVVQAADTQKLLPGITVRLNALSQVTDEAGFFRFTNQPAGAAKLIVAAPNYVNVNRNIELTAALQTEDIVLTPTEAQPLDPRPSPTPSTILLLPDGTATSAPEPSSSPVPSATPTPSSSPTATPSPEPSPPNELNEAATADVLISSKTEGLRLSFTLNKSNGLPVNWSDQEVYIEYYIATSDNQLLTSGKSFISASGENLVVSLGGRSATPDVNVDINLLLPNQKVLLIRKTINVQGS